MSPNKLRLKRTPEEQAEHDLRKARKAARRAAKHLRRQDEDDYDNSTHSHQGRRRRTSDGNQFHDSDSEYGPQPAASTSGSSSIHRAHKPDYDRIQAEVEEQRFREKLWDAFGDDERLDSVETSLNSYAHVPRRWRGGGMERMDDELNIDPLYMEDEEYAEWIRAGMWRKKHAAEHEEQVRKQAEHDARKAKEKAIREETKRLERAEEERRKQRRRAREQTRALEARDLYDSRWRTLLDPTTSVEADETTLGLIDVPWPMHLAYPYPVEKGHNPPVLRVEDFTIAAISYFLLPPAEDQSNLEAAKKERRERLREAMLRFHPDKFEGRVMARVHVSEREAVREMVGVVARTLNTLMAQERGR